MYTVNAMHHTTFCCGHFPRAFLPLLCRGWPRAVSLPRPLAVHRLSLRSARSAINCLSANSSSHRHRISPHRKAPVKASSSVQQPAPLRLCGPVRTTTQWPTVLPLSPPLAQIQTMKAIPVSFDLWAVLIFAGDYFRDDEWGMACEAFNVFLDSSIHERLRFFKRPFHYKLLLPRPDC